MAIVSIVALLAALALAALISIQPWATNAVTPSLGVAPGLGIALGDSEVVARPQIRDVAGARAVAGAHQANFVVKSGPTSVHGSVAVLAVAPAHPVTRVEPASPGPEQPWPEPTPAPQAPPSPTPGAVPVSAPVTGSLPQPSPPPPTRTAAGPGSDQEGPITAGGGTDVEIPPNAVEVCAGDEFTLSLPPSADPLGGGEPVPAAAAIPHEAIVYFGTSSEGDGFYLVFLDGQPIVMGTDLDSDAPGGPCTQIDLELLRAGELVEGTFEIHVATVTLDDTLEPALP